MLTDYFIPNFSEETKKIFGDMSWDYIRHEFQKEDGCWIGLESASLTKELREKLGLIRKKFTKITKEQLRALEEKIPNSTVETLEDGSVLITCLQQYSARLDELNADFERTASDRAPYSYIQHKRIEKISEILASIKTHGLSADIRSNRLRSDDETPKDVLCLNVVDTTPGSSTRMSFVNQYFSQKFGSQPPEMMNSVLGGGDVLREFAYRSPNGLWSLLLERQTYAADFDRAELEERVKSGILFIMDVPENGVRTDDLLWEGEIEIHEPISSDKILAIIAPEGLKDAVHDLFSDHPIFYVGNTVAPIALCTSSPKIPGDETFLEGADFYSGLKLACAELGKREIACHITRLPTRRDMKRLYNSMLSMPKLLSFYGVETPAQALCLIASGKGKREDVEFICSLPENADAINLSASANKRTPLNCALSKKAIDLLMIRALIAAGADYSSKDESGYSAKQWARNHKLDLENICSSEISEEEEGEIFSKRREQAVEVLKAANVSQFELFKFIADVKPISKEACDRGRNLVNWAESRGSQLMDQAMQQGALGEGLKSMIDQLVQTRLKR